MRQGASTSWEAWEKFITSGNYTSYTVKKDGTGAGGTWGISVSGNAASATKLATARNINGVSFDGTGNITVYSPRETFQFEQSLTTKQWYRLAKVSNSHCFSCRLQISNTYNYDSPMSVTFEISAIYGDYQKVTQISGGGNVAILPKIRLVRKLGSEWYIEAYYNGSTSGNTFNFNFSSISPVSSLTNSFTTGSIPSGYTVTEFELLPNAGKTSVTGSGAISVAVENDTEYRYTNVSTLNITYPSSGNFECWIRASFATSGTRSIAFPAGTSFIGSNIGTPAAGGTYEISIKDKVVIIKKVG